MSEVADKPRWDRQIIVRSFLVAVGLAIAAFLFLFIVAIVFYGNVGDDTKDGQAKSGVMTLTHAVTAYALKYDEYPAKLWDLVDPPDGASPFVVRDAIIDPWQRPYQYDPIGPRNNGEQPDIWTTGHDGQLIGNWPKR